MKILLFCLSLFISSLCFSQSYNYAIYCKDTLCSEYMAGRAYRESGDKKAAEFIRNELTKNNVKLLGDNGFQTVGISINNILDVELKMNNLSDSLKLGEDFLVTGSSPTSEIEIKNIKPLIFNNKEQISDVKIKKLKDKVLLFNMGDLTFYDIMLFVRSLVKENINPKLAIVQNYDKIEYLIGSSVLPFPVLQLKGRPFKKKIDYLKLSIESTFDSDYESQNVWAVVEGTKYKDSCFVFVSHYDHLGKVGNVYFPGANDNASGVSVLLDLAGYYAKNPAEYSVVFIFVTGEETGLLGSSFAAMNPLVDLTKIKFLFNLDMCGTGSTGVAVINGKKEKRAGELLQKINSENNWFSKIVLGEESCNSDHCPFVKRGVPAHFLFTYGCEYNEYHTIYDNGKALFFTKHIDFCNLLKEFVRRYR